MKISSSQESILNVDINKGPTVLQDQKYLVLQLKVGVLGSQSMGTRND